MRWNHQTNGVESPNHESHASKVLLGAPRMDTITDLWNSLHFLKPGIFSGPDTFDMWFQQPPLSDIDDIGLSPDEEISWVRELNASQAPAN